MNQDETFIQIAIEEARKADWPFGAVIVKDGEIIAQAGSGDGKDVSIDPTAHAETNAIRRASEKLQTGDLSGAILYGSCEPCAQCFGAAWYAGIRHMVFGTSIKDIEHIDQAWGGDLAFPHDHIEETGIHMKGGVLRDDVMDMFESHPRVLSSELK